MSTNRLATLYELYRLYESRKITKWEFTFIKLYPTFTKTSTKQESILKSILSKCKLPDKPNPKKAFSVAKIKDKWYLIVQKIYSRIGLMGSIEKVVLFPNLIYS